MVTPSQSDALGLQNGLMFLGGGKMAEALLTGVLAGVAESARQQVTVVETLPARRAELVQLFPGVHVAEHAERSASAVVLAVKPADMETACRSLERASVQRVLSIAAGISIAQLQTWLPSGVAVVRSMPNTPALVGQGASAISGGDSASAADVQWAAALLGKVGKVVTVPESKLDAVTGLSGSGPAYVFLVAEALIEAGVLVGLPRDTAELLAKQTLLGAATLLNESADDAAKLRANVTSPGGTTAAGLRALEDRAVRAAFIDAVAAATNRSIELRG
jgi:pyrroline-5-carboxylate reductase